MKSPLITNKKILVAGGVGFLGTTLCKKLLAMNNEVIALDNLYTGRQDNVTLLQNYPGFSFINHDIIEPIDMSADLIFNLACPASPPHYQRDPIFTTKTSVLGSLNLLELARKNNARILQASTSEVYGDPEQHPQPENYRGSVNPIGIRACYDEGKRCAESLFFDYNRMHGVAIKVVRIFNTYGPHMDPQDGRVVSNFIMQALNNKPLTMYGTGAQTRSFCFVDDLVDGIIAMMASPQAFTGPVNLGNPTEFNLLELAQMIIELTGSTSNLVFLPLPQDDPQQRKPDISLAQEKLGWVPRVALREGLEKTIPYFARSLDTFSPTLRPSTSSGWAGGKHSYLGVEPSVPSLAKETQNKPIEHKEIQKNLSILSVHPDSSINSELKANLPCPAKPRRSRVEGSNERAQQDE
ncbi:SDR family oxidoreductase [Candidatus Babeliales bacterium]|nr:SDR family oxidoreductase [Candidatus Babeliales bacterium]